MPLRVVPPSEPTPAENVILRVKKMPRPDGLLQCNRCGGNLVLNTSAGVIVKNGRKAMGTVIDKDVCGHCWKRGIFSSMLPAVKPAT